MNHTYEIKNFEKSFDLGNDTIDNRAGNLKMTLKSAIFWIGYLNISNYEKNQYRVGSDESEFFIATGLYDVDQLVHLITSTLSWVSIKVNKYNGKFKLQVPENNAIKFSEDIARLFSLNTDWLSAGSHIGKVDMQPFKAIYLHCDQISSTNNIFNGKPSKMLGVIPLGNDPYYGSSIHTEWSTKIEKSLENGIINEMKFRIKDADGNDINNEGLPLIITLEIK